MRTWLLVAAERREFDGLLKRFEAAGSAPRTLHWPGARFARKADWKGDRWWMIANGAGPEAVRRALGKRMEVNGIISTGLCGALAPALRAGDIVACGAISFSTARKVARGKIYSMDRVAVTASEKETLRNAQDALAVDMESAAVAQTAAEWGVPYAAIRAVSDTASEDLPLDFNRFRSGDGNFSRTRIALAAVARPFTVMPRLLEFDRHCRHAADVLGAFLADCRF